MDNKDLIIREKTRRIIDFLGFYDRKTSGTELENIIKTYKYVVQNINPNLSYREKHSGLDVNTNYNNILLVALDNNPGLPTSNNVLFHHLLSGIDVDSYLVLCKSNSSGEPHVSTLVKIKNEYYYFDPSLERSIADENAVGTDRPLMLCAAMGRSDYEKLYNPVQVLRKPGKKSKDTFPKNIADESIAKIIINAINLRLPNLRVQRDIKPDERAEDLEIE